MLPNFAALDLRRRAAPTGVILGNRARDRWIQDFEERFRHQEGDAPLSSAVDHFLTSELNGLRDTLVAEGPAERALLRAMSLSTPIALDVFPEDSQLVSNARAEWAEKEQALSMLREMWSHGWKVHSHIAKKITTNGMLSAIVNCLSERMFAHDLRSEALATLSELTSETSGNILVQWGLLMTDAQTDAVVSLACSLVDMRAVTEDDRNNTKHAMSLLHAFTSQGYNFAEWEGENPDDGDMQWARSFYRLFETEGRDDENEPSQRACRALRSIDDGVEKVIFASEMVVNSRGREYHNISREVSYFGIHTLKSLMYDDVKSAESFMERDGLERIMSVFYDLGHTNRLRGTFLSVVELFIHQACTLNKIPTAIEQVQDMLPQLFSHWYEMSGSNPNERTGKDEMWELMRQLSLNETLKNVLLLSEDCYKMLRDVSDHDNNDNDEMLRKMYAILHHTLKEPTTPEMWARLTELHSGGYWVQLIIDELMQFFHSGGMLANVPNWKWRTLFAMMEKREFLDACIAQLHLPTLRELAQLCAYKLYKGTFETPCLDTLKALAADGRVWKTVSRTIEQVDETGNWGPGSWSRVVEALHDDDVLAQAACSDPWASPVAALVLLHKLNEAHAPLLSTWPLSKEAKAQLLQRQQTFQPLLDKILEKHTGLNSSYGSVVAEAVAFARKLLRYPSLENPEQAALSEEFERKRQRLNEGGQSVSTDGPANTGAAFVSLLARLSLPLPAAAPARDEDPAAATGGTL